MFLIIGYVIILAASLGTYSVHGSLAALWVQRQDHPGMRNNCVYFFQETLSKSSNTHFFVIILSHL